MGSKQTIERLLATVDADPANMAARLQLADLYLRQGDAPRALALYDAVGKHCADRGFPLKAIAVYQQICATVVTHAPHLRPRYAHVPPILFTLFERFGMTERAAAALDALGTDAAPGNEPS